MLKFKDLCLEVTKNEEATITWLKNKNIIRTSLLCRKCSSSCNFVPRKDGYAWRCTRKGCQSVLSIRDGTLANTLLPIIQTYIRPGTSVFSDEWRAYSQITSLGLSHSTVNHSINFVDPISGAHTQNIESTWSFVKKMLRKQGVMNTSSSLFQTYLPEYLWRRKFKEEDTFIKIYDHNY